MHLCTSCNRRTINVYIMTMMMMDDELISQIMKYWKYIDTRLQSSLVNEFVYHSALTHSSVYGYGIHRHSGFTHSVTQNSDNCIWKS